MNCYLCDNTGFKERKGRVRDAAELRILECTSCGLVTLSSLEHIKPGFYENSGMHGEAIDSIEAWLKETEWDDQRRFDMLKPMLVNKKVLDFGCGAGGFLNKAAQLAAGVHGIEPERRVREYWPADSMPG
jgi:2-polyprenyl-3-methyl-5-hydroxy-6-metoxy-1,4-benzoquinol methylase